MLNRLSAGFELLLVGTARFVMHFSDYFIEVIKGLAGSGVQIVSISERTPDFETIRPKIKRWFELLTSSGPNWSTPINL